MLGRDTLLGVFQMHAFSISDGLYPLSIPDGKNTTEKGGRCFVRMREASLARISRCEEHGLGAYSDALRTTPQSISRGLERMCGRTISTIKSTRG